MTNVRLISLALRSGLLMAAGTALIAVPFMIGLGPAPIATGLGVGVMMVALALAGTDTGGRGTLPVSAHAVYDRAAALGLLLAAVVFELAGEPGASVVFGVAGAATLAVTSVTRYSARPV